VPANPQTVASLAKAIPATAPLPGAYEKQMARTSSESRRRHPRTRSAADVSGYELRDLCDEKGIHLIEDLGSGSLIDLSKFGLSYERTVKDCINEGIDLVSFSGDKILGGPQAGIIVGKKELISKIKKNQLLRAFRVDKFTLGALEETLKFYLDDERAIANIPTLKMISMPKEEILRKA